MRTLSRFLLLSFIIFCSTIELNAQVNFASNVRPRISSNNDYMFINYDIEEQGGTRFYNVMIIISHNDEPIDAKSILGDYGSKTSGGKDKKIAWKFKDDFSGDINAVKIDIRAYKELEPQAVFSHIVGNSGYAPCEVRFVNTSEYADQYKWVFGDPASNEYNSSSDKEPFHIYNRGGNYTVTLVASNTALNIESKFIKSFEIREHPPTIANFENSSSDLEAPFDVVFNEASTNADSFMWDFGDPASGSRKNASKEKNPKHKYKTAGTFTVRLIVNNSVSNLSDTLSRELVLTEPEAPTAMFLATMSTEIAPAIAVFSNTSTNATSFSWDFGDPGSGSGNKSSEKNPSYTYVNAGAFKVKLTAENTQTGKSSEHTQIIEVGEPPKPPEAKFAIENNNSIAPTTVIFTNQSQNADLFSWDFGDFETGESNKSVRKNPTHTYTVPGRYKVTLTSTSTALNKSSEFTDFITITEPSKPPVASFTYSEVELYAPAFVSFSNSSSNADKYSWDFGDPESGNDNTSSSENTTHTFSKPGNFKVSLTVTNSNSGEVHVHSQLIKVKEAIKLPVAAFEIISGENLVPANVSFINKSENSESYLWNFGDPDSKDENSSTLENPSHKFLKAGTYTVKLISKNSRTSESGSFTQTLTLREAIKDPVADFTIDETEAIAPATISFLSSAANTEEFYWDFGDPNSGDKNTSKSANPTHTYDKSGSYVVTLACTNTQSEFESTKTREVIIVEPVVIPIAGFDYKAEASVAPASMTFSNTSTLADFFSWNFGDPESGISNTSSVKNPVHLFQKEGTYNVTLNARNESSGETNKFSKSVVITKPIPLPEADFTYSLQGDVAPVEVVFTSISKNGDRYEWDFGDTGSENNLSTDANTKHLYANPGKFQVKLSLTNSTSGKVDVTTKELNIVSEYKTFVYVDGEDNNDEFATSVLQEGSDEYIVLVNKMDRGSKIIRINGEGQILENREYLDNLFDLSRAAEGNGYVVSGFQDPGMLTIQNLSNDLIIDEPVLIEGVDSISRDYSIPRIAVSDNNEVGITGNILEGGIPKDVWFQKLDTLGVPVPVRGATFKFMGIKLENELIPSEEGGFVLTGFWQEDENKPKRLMFASVDSNGKGSLKSITAQTNFIGCDIVSSHTGGYGILAAQGNPMDESNYNLVFMVVDLDGGPVSVSGTVHGNLKQTAMNKFPPSVIKTDGGYVIVSHFYNGTDYDINIAWIDITGEMILKSEVISMPGDQFATDFIKGEDGSFIIIGAEQIGDTYDYLILRTDPFGRVNPGDN